MTRDRARLGLIGLGDLGSFHAENLARRIATAELCCVADANPDRSRTIGQRLGVPWTSALDSLLGDDRLDGVVVASSTVSHPDIIEAAARRGLHVFTEKPIALDVPETIRAIDAAQSAGVILQVGFHRRFDSAFRRLRSNLDQAMLGRVYLLRVGHRDMAAPAPGTYLDVGGTLLVDATIHDFDTARWLVGEVESVTAFASSVADPRFAETGDADHVVVVLRFENGALGVIDNSRCAGYGYECTVELLGSQATARIHSRSVDDMAWLTPGSVSEALPRDHRERHAEAYVAELAAFVAAIAAGAPSPVPAGDALAAFSLSLAAEESRRRGLPVQVAHEPTRHGSRYAVATEA